MHPGTIVLLVLGQVFMALAYASAQSFEEAQKQGYRFWDAMGSLDEEVLRSVYAPEVTLLPGSEMLKERHGLSKAGRSIAAKVSSQKLVSALVQLVRQDEEGEAAWRANFKPATHRMEFSLVSQAVNALPTREGTARYPLQAGDVVMQVFLRDETARPNYTFVLRREGAAWVVVAEQADWY